MTAAWLPRNRLRLRISEAIILEFNLDVEAIDREFLKVFVRIFRTYLPSIHFNGIAVADESCIEGDSEYLRIACHLLVLKDNHNISV